MRPIWKGAINFGLIYIPVKLYKASQERKFHFHYLHKNDLCPIRYVRVCKHTGKEISYKDIVKGYEYAKDDYVILNDEDFQRASPEKYQSVNISSFVEESQIDPKYLEKPYYLEPDKNAEGPYILLREALKKTKKVGIGKFMLRNREHLAAIRAESDVLVLEQLRFKKELIEPNELKIPTKKVSPQELEMAAKLIEQLSSDFNPDKFEDTYFKELKKIIEAKKNGKLDQIKIKKIEPYLEIPNMMEQLKQSLEQSRQNKSNHNELSQL